MKRIVLASVALIALAWLSGCTSSGGSLAGTQAATPPSSGLSGQFAFVLSGYDPSVSPYVPIVMAGSFTADGQGHITAGDVDVNDNGVSSSSTALAGTYAFDTFSTSGTVGYGSLGTITLTNSVGSVTHPLKFGFALNSGGTFGGIMDLSANNFIMSGTMQKQTVLSLAGLAGNWVVSLSGRSQTVPTSVVGRFTLAAGGAVSASSFDRSMSGSALGTAGPTTSAVITSFTTPDGNGRGTFTLALSDALASTPTQTFAYYAISALRFVAAETDANGSMMVDAESQSTPPTSALLTGSAFGMAGFDTTTASEISTVGQLVISSATSGTVADDSNDNGAINTNAALAIPAVTYNAVTGRGTATVTNGVASGFANSLVFYLTSTAGGTSFIMDNTSGTTNRAMSGPLTAQTGVGSFSTASDLPGSAVVRAKGIALNDAEALVAEFSLTSTAGSYALVDDARSPATTGSTSIITGTPDTSIFPITLGALSASTGRGTLLIGSETLAYYVIQPNQIVFIDISPSSNANNGPSPLFLATPD